MARTKKRHIDDFTLSFNGPSDMKAKTEDVIPWRLAFPEFAGNEKGAILKGTRLRDELTQKQLSEKTGIPQRHISEMETGKRQVGRKRAEILAGALNVSDYRIFL